VYCSYPLLEIIITSLEYTSKVTFMSDKKTAHLCRCSEYNFKCSFFPSSS